MPGYGAKPTGSPTTIVIRLPREPRCPGCCEWLQSAVVEFRHTWAWCPVCIKMELPENPHLIYALGTTLLAEHTYTIRGLNFYMPRSTMGRPKNALDFYDADPMHVTSNSDQAINA